MRNSQRLSSEIFLLYLSLAFFIILGIFLRFWHLDLKPLWMDEVITAIFSNGKTYNDLPLDVVLPLDKWSNYLTLETSVTCPQIANNLATQSTHPPLFFCGMHNWLSWLNIGSDSGRTTLSENWIFQLRSLPAFSGVLSILAIYLVNKIAFGFGYGIIAAALMSVSPFSVYLSQEARHYTLPMFFITLSIACFMEIQADISRRVKITNCNERINKNTNKIKKINLLPWCGWILFNSLGLWTHYFCILSFVAQILTLVLLFSRKNIWHNITTNQTIESNPEFKPKFIPKRILQKLWLLLTLSSLTVILTFLPWLSTLIYHFTSSETQWLHSPTIISPIYQTLAAWLIMFVAFPVEQQPLGFAIFYGLLMIFIGIWVGKVLFSGFRALWKDPSTHIATLTLTIYLTLILLSLFAIAYLLGKDITAIPRYNFIYFPAFCALSAACLGKYQSQIQHKKFLYIFLCIGIISSINVTSNLVFKKPFLPTQVAQTINREPSLPTLVVVGYKSNQDIALGLSYAIALEQEVQRKQSVIALQQNSQSQKQSLIASVNSQTYTENTENTKDKAKSLTQELSKVNFAFFSQEPSFQNVWNSLTKVKLPTQSPLNMWVVAPGLRRRDYPQQVQLSSQTLCHIDPKHHYRIGIPYQLYRCGDFKRLEDVE